MSWTPSQLQAISANEGNFLVSAGAGSGKTAVLTERAFRLVQEKKCRVDELLILTFSKKAAGEMKERIRNRFLKEGNNGDLESKKLAQEVDSASIMTFDAFCNSLVVKHHNLLGLRKDLSIAPGSVLRLERKKTLEKILSSYYEERNETWLKIINALGAKNDNAIEALILQILSVAELKIDKKLYLETCCNNYFSDEFLESIIKETFTRAKAILAECLSLSKTYEGDILADNDCSFFQGLLDVSSFDNFVDALGGATFKTIPRGSSEEDKSLRKQIKQLFNKDVVPLASFGHKEEIKASIQSSKPTVTFLVDTAKKLDEAVSQKMKEASLFDFADIASFAREIVSIPSISEELSKQYKFVMIDEYQDTSDLQEDLLAAFCKNNVFMVGDLKQSIYLFRNANPDIFLKKSIDFASKKGGELITLAKNFRSREEVLTSINSIFLKIMNRRLGGVDYLNGQALEYGNKACYDASSNEIYTTDTLLLSTGEGDARALSAQFICDDIISKINSGFPVYDYKSGLTRPAEPKDFAILASTKSSFLTYQRVFGAASLPIAVSDDIDVSTEAVTLTLFAFARLYAGFHDEATVKHCYAAIKRSYLFMEEDEEIYHSIKSGDYLSSPLIKEVEGDLSYIETHTIGESVSHIISTFGFIDHLDVLGATKNNFEKLINFVSIGDALSRLGYDFSAFATFQEDLKSSDEELKLSAPIDTGNSVKLMSIHASKGLEFPIVYLPELERRFFKGFDKETMFADQELGISVPSLDEPSTNSILKKLRGDRLNLALTSEKTRLLYVAMTRAKEKLILLFCDSGKEQKADLILPKSFASMLKPLNFHPKPVSLLEQSLFYKRQETVIVSRDISFLPFSVISKEKEKTRASKELPTTPDYGALSYGERLHKLMELVDFASLDSSFIEDKKDKEVISKVLALPFFSAIKEAKAFHEYQFLDPITNVHGVIDLLLVFPDHAAVVDFKAGSIDDPEYGRQLSLYSAFVERTFSLPCEEYLLSLRQARLNRLK